LTALMNDTPDQSDYPVVVTSARALMQRTLPPNQFRKATLTLELGQRHVIDALLRRFMAIGYQPVSVVIDAGTFSRRGGIIDIFPLAADLPVRIEFFDDEIDSLRAFDPSSQRSAGTLQRIVIPPAREALPEHTPPVAAHLKTWFDGLPKTDEPMTSALADADSLANGVPFAYSEHYLPYLYPHPVSLLDYAPANALIVIEDYEDLRDTILDIAANAARTREEQLATQQIAPDHPTPYLDWDALDQALQGRNILYLSHDTAGVDLKPAPTDEPNRLFTPGERFGGQLKPLLSHLRDFRKQQDRAVVVSQQAARLTELWHEQESFVPTVEDILEAPARTSVLFVNGMLQEGWTLHTDGGDLHLLTDAEIFGWSRPEPHRRKRGEAHRARLPESHYADWKDGDYVVHVDYGIGRFSGMRIQTIEGVRREYLVVGYAGTDTLLVPIHHADRLTRYIGPDDKPPAINKLGQPADWIRIKSKAQRSVEEEARELLDLYAKRAHAHRNAFSPDSHWQHELEASFPYVETEDQLRALREVKADLERATPMDRLVCGDVGYGNTEVALRAAFKAVEDGKQVAVLVPTTVLAQQHYETFSQRLAAFPVQVEALSRFRTKEEQNRILPKLASGEIDIIIGTHRLLSDDVHIKNLGLVIIDEEQRFGVKHKEHFKKLRTQVDVLTLTATPIPRTMYMALTNVRDISMIQTPPEDRLPVITHVGMYDEHLVRQAILRELERGGQVFYVHNRVRTIEAARERVERIVPEARVIVGHGQMNERQLERVMAAFNRSEYDILVSTSIIESGLDIPSANTLIVDRAEWFGMAQLYQLRGRVGRSAQQAYAYFFHAGTTKLTEDAHQRLDALAENSDLGAGFQIAMRDLELRGAGDILSTKQTGHVAAIGLHLYTQLLARAVQDLKHEAGMHTDGEMIHLPATTSVILDLPLAAYLPTDWIPEMALRLQIYRRIANLSEGEEVDAIRDELRDRFGQLPAAVEGLLYQIRVKLLAQAANATAVLHTKTQIQIKLPYLVEINRERLEAQLGGDVQVTRTAVLLPLEGDWQKRLLDILAQLAQGVKAGVGM
jgi:transcription-repair coupling factor (superfamily II helicase)